MQTFRCREIVEHMPPQRNEGRHVPVSPPEPAAVHFEERPPDDDYPRILQRL